MDVQARTGVVLFLSLMAGSGGRTTRVLDCAVVGIFITLPQKNEASFKRHQYVTEISLSLFDVGDIRLCSYIPLMQWSGSSSVMNQFTLARTDPN